MRLDRYAPKNGAYVQDLCLYDMKQGKLDKILAENEIDIVKADIEKYYKSVFSD